MLNITINQIIKLWSELEQCYYNKNTYGGDTCEIYEYTVLPRNLFADSAVNDDKSTLMNERNQEITKDMWTDLFQIFNKFSTDRNCVIKINNQDLKDITPTRFHRIHVTVTRSE